MSSLSPPVHEANSGPDNELHAAAAFYGGQEYHHHGYYQHQQHHQNSPYFPAAAAMYPHQPHYHHYHSHEAVAVPSDFSPGSEASNDYFYGGSASAAISNGAASGYASVAPSSSSAFTFDATEPISKSMAAGPSAVGTMKKSKLQSLQQPQQPPMGVGSNKKERRRTQSINNAFASLRDCIPNVPCDTKLSKIKTLRLATSYIDYLMQLLNSENVSSNAIHGFKADIHKRWKEKTEEQKRRELEEELNNNGGTYRRMTKPCKGGARTGWPQHVWALELKQ